MIKKIAASIETQEFLAYASCGSWHFNNTCYLHNDLYEVGAILQMGTDAQRGEVTCPRSHSQWGSEATLNSQYKLQSPCSQPLWFIASNKFGSRFFRSFPLPSHFPNPAHNAQQQWHLGLSITSHHSSLIFLQASPLPHASELLAEPCISMPLFTLSPLPVTLFSGTNICSTFRTQHKCHLKTGWSSHFLSLGPSFNAFNVSGGK